MCSGPRMLILALCRVLSFMVGNASLTKLQFGCLCRACQWWRRLQSVLPSGANPRSKHHGGLFSWERAF